MNTLTGITLCSGGGLAALGMQQAGVRLVGAVEYDSKHPDIADVYAANLGDHVLRMPVQDADARPYTGIDVLQVSPPCTRASLANPDATEGPLDTTIAAAVVRWLETTRPKYFWLENVEGYARFAAYKAIRAALDNLNYWSHAAVVNAADYGVPQTRRRLILRAVAGGLWQPFRPLPAPVPWVGWYAAIEDLLPTLPESAFAPWQLARLPVELRESILMPFENTSSGGRHYRTAPEPSLTIGTEKMPRAFLLNTSADKWGDGLRGAAQPAATIRTGQQHLPRAFVVEGTDLRNLTVRTADEPIYTIKASRAWLDQGRVVRLTPRALARFQSVSDRYRLPDSNALACRVLGNGVPVLVAQAVTASLLDEQEVAA